MPKVHSSATELVGRMSLVRINGFADGADATVPAKLEFYNPVNSVKDRTAVATIGAAVATDKLPEGGTVVKGTSGNTGIGLAWVGAARGYKVILTASFSMPKERRVLLRTFGTEPILTEPTPGMYGAVDKAKKIVASTNGAILASQFASEANPAVHEKTTSEEIWEDTDGKVDYLISGVGMGGIITGTGRALRRHNLQVKLIAVEPVEPPLLSGRKAGSHKIQGFGANFVPDVPDTDLYGGAVTVFSDEAIAQARRAVTDEGPFVGIPSDAALAAAVEIAKRSEAADKTIVVIIPDFGECYVSTVLFEGLVD